MIDRPLVLTVRHGSAPPRRGEELDCWVFANETNQTVLTADRRGRSPVSERMAGRYAAALNVLAELTGSEGGGDDATAAVPDARGRLSELQGMANRVLRRDQADWVDVLHLFGDPDRDSLGVLRDLAASANRALKEGTLQTSRLAEKLAASGWAEPLAAARRELLDRFPAATGPGGSRPDPGRTASGGLLPDAPQQAPRQGPQQAEQKEEGQMSTAGTPSTSPAPTAGAAKEGLLRTLETAAQADRACKKHEAVRHALKASLLWADLQPTDSPVVDVSCVTDRGLFLYEALGAGRSSYADLRSGATRLLEINYSLPTRADGLYLVLPEPPAEDWSADTLHDVFGVHVIWRGPAGWAGEGADLALAPSGARLR
ncbi:hypothetical protein ACQEVS_28405 [Streptomyces sp. CA-181903]|uniref:hypothetical protein n=1 Tax=Streptomyces sp. CA-181903 TaxID=3240055 RepID=UPI003D8E1677